MATIAQAALHAIQVYHVPLSLTLLRLPLSAYLAVIAMSQHDALLKIHQPFESITILRSCEKFLTVFAYTLLGWFSL